MAALPPLARQSGRRGRRGRLSETTHEDRIRRLEKMAEILGFLVLIGGFILCLIGYFVLFFWGIEMGVGKLTGKWRM